LNSRKGASLNKARQLKKFFNTFSVLVLFLNLFLLSSAKASEPVDYSDQYYPQLREFTYDYSLNNNRFSYSARFVMRYHRNPVTFIQLIYVTAPNDLPGCKNNAPTTFNFGRNGFDPIKRIYQSPDSLNNKNRVSRVQDGDWFIDEYLVTVSEEGFRQDYYDYVSKCGPRVLTGVLFYDISGKAVSIDESNGTHYQWIMDRRPGSTSVNGTYDTEQLKCQSLNINLGTGFDLPRSICNHNISMMNYPISYTEPAKPQWSTSAIAKAKAEAEAKAKAEAEAKAKAEAEAKAAAELKAKQDAEAAAKAAAAKKMTITCVKGKTLKKVTAVKPKCPSGYKKK
jgi:hypothetical protein